MDIVGLMDLDLAPRAAEPRLLQLPNVPKPLHGVNPRTCLGRAWWNKERLAAYLSNNRCCLACGAHESKLSLGQARLEAHEEYETDYRLGRLTYVRAVPLCWSCHMFVHSGLLLTLAQKGSMTEALAVMVLHRGLDILIEHGLDIHPHGAAVAFRSGLPVDRKYQDLVHVLPTPRVPVDLAWGDWRLVVGNREFEPKFGSYEEWAKHYSSR